MQGINLSLCNKYFPNLITIFSKFPAAIHFLQAYSMHFELKHVPLLALCLHAGVSSAAPVNDATMSKRQDLPGWCGEDNKLCGGPAPQPAPPCSDDDDPTGGTCLCPAHGPMECPVTDPTWKPFQLPGAPPIPNTKRDLAGIIANGNAPGDAAPRSLTRRGHTTIKTREPLHDAIKVLGLDILQRSVTDIVVNKLDPNLKDRVVTGLAGKLSDKVVYNGITLPKGAPWTLRWDWDPTNLVHINLDAGKKSALSLLFQVDGRTPTVEYYNDVLNKLSQVADWPAIVSKMFPSTSDGSGGIAWDKAMNMEDAMTAVNTSLGDVLRQVVTFWTNLYNGAEQGHDLASEIGGGSG